VRSHLTLDDVDFTILAATSVLADLIPNCPPAEACRDAFTRMAKATISMCMSTTGFGVASSLGSQALDSPVSYVSPDQLSNDHTYDASAGFADAGAEISQRPTSMNERRQVPKFDMNLKDLFSDIELQGRPQSFFPRPGPRPGTSQQQQQQQQRQDPVPFMGTSYAIPSTPDTSAGTAPSPLQYQQQLNLAAQQRLQQQQQPQPAYNFQPLSQTISQQAPDFSFDTLDFLDTFPSTDPNANSNGMSGTTNNNNYWPSGDLDLGFGTGGMGGWEDSGSMEGVGAGGGGPDLFDGFFFGAAGGNGGGYGSQM
jgi:hypothetical protein